MDVEEIVFPSFRDILILAKNGRQGKLGLEQSLALLAPGYFERRDVEDVYVETVFISKRLLQQIPGDHIIRTLSEHIFPSVAEGTLLQVNFRVKVMIRNLSG